MQLDDRTEWLEPDGLGGFASGTTSGVRTRRYHALLLAATTPPTGRFVLVNGFDAWVDTAAGTFAISSQRYGPDVLYPNSAAHLAAFDRDPWPTWHFELPDGTRVLQEIFVEHGGACVVQWTLVRAGSHVGLRLRPLLSGRDYHALHHENGAFRFGASERGASVTFSSYEGVPEVVASSNGAFTRSPDWYRQFFYSAEQERGLDAVEDLASPGEFSWRLAAAGDRAIWVLVVASSSRYSSIWIRPVSDTCRRSRTAMPRLLRRGVRFRRGRSVSCCGSIESS
jgi:predicted glycogen debranching enzyme